MWLNSSVGCISPFDEIGVSFSGSHKSCCRIFAGRAFCKWRCDYECNFDSLMAVRCSDVTCGRNGRDPDQLHFMCYCTGQLKQAMGMTCNTMQHSWAEVESFHQQFCAMGMTPPRFGQQFGQCSSSDIQSDKKLVVVVACGNNGGGSNGQSNTGQQTNIENRESQVVNMNTTIIDNKIILVGAQLGNGLNLGNLNLGSLIKAGDNSAQAPQQTIDLIKQILEG